MKKNRENKNKNTITPSKPQNEFLSPLLLKYNEKWGALLKATQEMTEISKTIYDFSQQFRFLMKYCLCNVF